MGHCSPAICHINCHLFALNGMPANGGFNGACILFHNSFYDSKITPRNRMLLNLFCNPDMGIVIFADNQSSGGIHVNPVYNARPDMAINPGKAVPAVIHHCIHQSAGAMTCRWMYHHAFGFIYHQKVSILIKNIQRNWFRKNFRLLRRRNCKLYQIFFRHPVIGFLRLLINKNLAFSYQFLKKRTGGIFADFREKLVQTLSALLRIYLKFLYAALFLFPERI